jgi:hypothetical protein
MLTLANRKSHNRYCESHNDHSHDTEVCVALCFEIEKMIMNGKLTRFLTNQQQQRPRQEQNPPRDHSPLRNNEGHQYEQRERQLAPRKNPLRNQEPIAEIHTISGGFAGGGESVPQKEKPMCDK